MEIMTASVALWEILALAALTTTCGMIHVHLREPAEIQLTSGKGRKMKDKIRESQKVKVTLKEAL